MPPSQAPATNAQKRCKKTPTNAPNKRKKTSGLSGLDLTQLKDSLAAFLKTVTATNEVGPSDNPQGQENSITLEQDFQEMLTELLMKSRLDGPQALSFSGMTRDDLLSKFNIAYGGRRQLKLDFQERADATKELGKTEHWSSEGLYRHLCVLHKLVPKVNEAASCAWIDAFLFRASEMVPQGKQLVLSLEQNVPSTTVKPNGLTTLGGYIDYTAISTSTLDAAAFLTQPCLDILLKHNHMPLVIKAKAWSKDLWDHIPQAVFEMYGCAKLLKKKIIRGAVTDGQNWIFPILIMNANDDGAKYADSRELNIMDKVSIVGEKVSHRSYDVIAGIIAHWIEHSDEDVREDDWFKMDFE